MEKSIKDVIVSSMNSLKYVVDSRGLIGEVIKISEDEFIVPISKLTFGIGVGGSDILKNKENNLLFEYSVDYPSLGGSVIGGSLKPEGFLYIKDKEVSIIRINENKPLYEKAFSLYKKMIKGLYKEKKKGSHK